MSKTKPSDQIELLTDFQHSRIRTEMFLSSRDPHTQTVIEYDAGKIFLKETTWTPAVFTAFREVFDNALDEVITHGHGDRIDVAYDPITFTFVVEDNGRGIPITFNKTHKKHLVTMALSETKAGRNFNERGSSRGLNGVGASIVNFCSTYFMVDVYRDGQHFNQRFNEGDGKNTNLVIEDPIILPSRKKTTGTRIEFQLSPKVFKHLILSEDFIKARIFETTLCFPHLKIFYNGQQVKTKSVEKDLFPDHKPIFFSIEDGNFKSDFWLVPEFFEDVEYSHSLVNAIPVFNGGVHIETFRKNFFSGIIAALTTKSKSKKLTPNKSDVGEGMLIFNITSMDAPEFDSQSKTRLINENVAKIINAAMGDPEFFKSVIRKNPDWIERIYERCAERTMKKDESELIKLVKKNKEPKVEKLRDATSKDRIRCTLFLAEGDSAISGLNEARDPEIHGGLPLRGKVLNVHGMSPKEIYTNEALLQIMNSIGLVPGQRAKIETLRYGKIYITTDADADGQNICALLINFFYTLWPELFDERRPFIYVFDTPLIIAAKIKQRKYWYSDDYANFDQEAHKGWDITRAKGLASLKKDDWKYVLANPKVTPIVDDGRLKDSLNLLFNNKLADERKIWIGM